LELLTSKPLPPRTGRAPYLPNLYLNSGRAEAQGVVAIAGVVLGATGATAVARLVAPGATADNALRAGCRRPLRIDL